MSHVDFKKWQCRMYLLLIFQNVICSILEKALSHVIIIFRPCRMSLSPMSHVESKKYPFRHVDFRGIGPLSWVLLCHRPLCEKKNQAYLLP